jgi:hypothetical protein
MGCSSSVPAETAATAHHKAEPQPTVVHSAAPKQQVPGHVQEEAAPQHEQHAAIPVKAEHVAEVQVHAAAPRQPATAPSKATAGQIDFAAIKAKLPFEKNDAEKEKRIKLFNAMDNDGTGVLSLAKVDEGLRDVLQIDEIFEVKPVIIRAFEAVKGVAEGKPIDGEPTAAMHPHILKNGLNAADYITFCEFRLLLAYLFHFFVLWEFFESCGLDGDDRMSADEFKASVPKLTAMGIQITDADEALKEITGSADAENILFPEFSHWALKKHLEQALEAHE